MSRVRTLCQVAGALWLGIGVVATLMPSRFIPADIVNNDGWAHAAAFGVAVALWTVALPGRAWAVLAVAAVAAVGSEVAQATLLAGRDAQWADVAADCAGIAVGLLVGLAASAALAGRERRVSV